MRFLFKCAFFLMLLFVAVAYFTPMPKDGHPIETGYSVLDALIAVKSTIADLGNFCDRNPDTCETGKSVVGNLGVKARDGARITYEFLDSKFGNSDEKQQGLPETINTRSTKPDEPRQRAFDGTEEIQTDSMIPEAKINHRVE